MGLWFFDEDYRIERIQNIEQTGRYLGLKGGYLPWHNFDEGAFDPADYARVSTDAFLEISGKHSVCNKCRHIFCTRDMRPSRLPAKPYPKPMVMTDRGFANAVFQAGQGEKVRDSTSRIRVE
jgi:hypothetical protein